MLFPTDSNSLDSRLATAVETGAGRLIVSVAR